MGVDFSSPLSQTAWPPVGFLPLLGGTLSSLLPRALLEGCCSQLRSDPGKARTPQGKQVKIISFKEVGGKVEPLEKGTGRKIKNLTPGHLEEELIGLKYKSELLVMNDVVVSTDDLGMIQEKETE